MQNDGQQVTLKTPLVTARITSTIFDEQPLAIFELDKVLLPRELFKGSLAPTPAPAPAPGPVADAPEPSKKHKSPPAPPAAGSPADGPAADQTAADVNGAVRFDGGRFAAVCFSLWLIILLL